MVGQTKTGLLLPAIAILCYFGVGWLRAPSICFSSRLAERRAPGPLLASMSDAIL